MKIKVLLLTAAMLLLCSCSLLPEEKQRQQAPVLEEYAEDPYTYVTVERGSVIHEVSAGAAVVAVDSATVHFADTERALDACLVSLGQQVRAGDVLCTLQSQDLAEQLVELETQLALQQLELDYCIRCNELDLEKEQILLSRMSTQAQKEEKQAHIDSLKREFEAEEQALAVKLAELQAQHAAVQQSYEQCTLRAPMDGTVTKIGADHRSFEVSDLSDCLLEIIQKDAHLFPVGTRVQLTLDDQMQTGTVLSAEQAGKADSKSVYILPDDPGVFSGTSRWTASYIAAQAEDTLYLPSSALRVAGGVDCVYIIGENGLITTCEVTVGIVGGGNTQILSGLTEGQQVIFKY